MSVDKERQARSRIAANTRWAKPGAREHQSQKMSAAIRRRLINQIDPDRVMPPGELEKALAAASRAWAARMEMARLAKTPPKPVRPALLKDARRFPPRG